MTDDLVAWLRAQLDEDERADSAIHDISVCQLAINGPADPRWGWECDCGHPARVLTEVAAKRRIIQEHDPIYPVAFDQPGVGGSGIIAYCTVCDDSEPPCLTLRLLAQPYAGRPGWREEWAVST